MALLTLQNIGKIYVSDGNVAVGIRGVNLSFDKGEFVAVTGKSGSGKSTLLNVISGMDSYEEGELYIEGEQTSHFLQPEWEEYREKYISFVFQDYNIIESFTVLQNVELALMHIDDKKERRRRALELLRRVGMESHIKHKGSRLSGGQKQRTVIARALAKDSPIILADEPTGNLDSATSKEIIELLREVSKDKLLIVVTHNFDQVADYATRHVRIFDGAVESDHVITKPSDVSKDKPSEDFPGNESKSFGRKARERGNKAKNEFKKGLVLGKTIFTSKPKLSFFLCLLMIIGGLGIFFITSLCSTADTPFDPQYMFNHIDGRVVVTTQDGSVLSEDEVKALVEKYGAVDYIRYDLLLDDPSSYWVDISANGKYEYVKFSYTFGKDYGDDIIGRYPEKDNEVFLYVPIYLQDILGKDEIEYERIVLADISYKIVGVKYFYDNTIDPECLFTSSGFDTFTAAYYMFDRRNSQASMTVTGHFSDGIDEHMDVKIYTITPSFEVEDGKIYVDSENYQKILKTLNAAGAESVEAFALLYGFYYNYNYNTGSMKEIRFERNFTNKDITSIKPVIYRYDGEEEIGTTESLVVSTSIIKEMVFDVLSKSYRQTSLFFEDDKAAEVAAEKLRDDGYIAVPSYTTYKSSGEDTIILAITFIFMVFMWFGAIAFLAFFISLCLSRVLGAFKGDMAIMRSMGIPVKIIRISMYLRMMISLIPAYIFIAVSAITVFTIPKTNEFFVFLHAEHYVAIFFGMIILTMLITRRQIKKLFGQSVKKSLKGGAVND